jgi:hypothetical protein
MVLRGQICMDNQTKPTIIGMARLVFCQCFLDDKLPWLLCPQLYLGTPQIILLASSWSLLISPRPRYLDLKIIG